MEEWLESKSAVPDDETEPFVVEYTIDIDPRDHKNSTFQFGISTKNLLRKCTHSDILATDNTYQIVYQGFPMGLVGTIDQDKHFHPIMFTLQTKERNVEVEFVLKSIKVNISYINTLYTYPSIQKQ